MAITRRDVLKCAGAAALAAASGVPQRSDAKHARWSSGDEPPTLTAPAGACDCHHHVYDPDYPAYDDTIDRPRAATVAHYMGLQRRLGIGRNVVVQPSAYGLDNRLVLAAVAAFGAAARGVAVVSDAVADADLRRMHGSGIRGIRFNFAPRGPTRPEMIGPLARRIEPLGWHVEVNAWAADLPGLMPILARLDAPVVLDHFGHIPEPEGASHPLFGQILRLIDSGKTWVKLAAPYDASKTGPPNYQDSGALARAYIRAAPERLVWGTNWPHPGETVKPDDARLLGLLLDWAPDPAVRKRILVDNPAILYDFPDII